MKNEISLLNIVAEIWSKRRSYLKWIFIFVLFSVVFAQTTPKVWYAENSVFLRSGNNTGLDNAMGGLASLAGVNLSNDNKGELNPLAYEEILSSDYFIEEIINDSVYYRATGDSISIYDFFDLYQKSSLTSKTLGLFNQGLNSVVSIFKKKSTKTKEEKDWISEDFLVLTGAQRGAFSDIKGSIAIDFDPKTSLLSVGFKSQDYYISAQVTDKILTKLKSFVNQYYLVDLQRKYKFAKEQLIQKKEDFNNAQLALAAFKDRNITIKTNSARIEEQKLQQEYNLAFNIYSEIALTVQDIEIDLQGRRPVFEIVGRTPVPLAYSSPNKKMFVLIGAFFGFIFCSILILASIDIKKSLTKALNPLLKIIRK